MRMSGCLNARLLTAWPSVSCGRWDFVRFTDAIAIENASANLIHSLQARVYERGRKTMAGATFKTNPYRLQELLQNCDRGLLQLPDFQRSWVWDEDRIKSLIASVSRAFPIGALMTLETGGEVDFKPRPIERASATSHDTKPQALLLDGQQRMTSLYQVALRGKVVETVTPKKKKVKRWFYIDIAKALDPALDRDDAIVSLPEDLKSKYPPAEPGALRFEPLKAAYPRCATPASLRHRGKPHRSAGA